MSAPAATSAYRPDIDGLRAIAVLSVVGYHAFPHSLHGGFIGVDIFFVISGFLISGLIFHDLGRQRFTFRRFYARRFRRIFPALLVVLAATLIYGGIALAPDEFRDLGKQAAAGAGFLSNVLQWSQAGYFDQKASAKPLLHLWSLGVEEQFYIAWPIVIVLVYGRRSRLLKASAGLMLASFLACVLVTRSDPSAAFFLPMTRFWELLAGALLAYVFMVRASGAPTSDESLPPRLSEAAAWLGLAIIVLGLCLIGKERAFPGWWALLPVAGTTLLIATPQAWLNRRMLSNRWLVWVGLISYPLYLWHWVLLTFLRIANHGEEPSRFWILLAVAAAFVLAWLTYAAIERPIRFSTHRDAIPRTLVAAMAALGIAALAVDLSDGLAFRYPAAIQDLAAFNYDQERQLQQRAYRDGDCLVSGLEGLPRADAGCIDKPRGNRPLVVLWGDSHAASLYPGLREEQEKLDFRIAQFTATGCPPLVDAAAEERARCKIFSRAVIERLATLKPAVVILEAHWALYSEANSPERLLDAATLRKTVETLQSMSLRRIVVMGSLPTWKIYQPRVAFEVWRHEHVLPERTREDLDPAPFEADRLIRAALSGTAAAFVPPMEWLCPDGACLIFADPRHAITVAWDNDHLSIAGSHWLIERAAPSIFGDGIRSIYAASSR